MKKFLILIGTIVFSTCCSNHEINLKIASVDDELISSRELDSLASTSIYEIKKQVLETLIKKKVVEIEAKKQNITLPELIKKEVEDKDEIVTDRDFQQYILENNIISLNIDSLNIVTYLKKLKEKDRYENFADSLIKISNISVSLFPEYPEKVELDDVISFNLTPMNQIVVYIISDYNCTACQSVNSKIQKIIDKNKNMVNFRYVCFSDYISKKALASNAASLQEKFTEMHYSLLSHYGEMTDEEIYKIANEIGLDLFQFKKDFKNPHNLKKLLKTKEKLIEKGIYSTPTFVVNSKKLDNDLALFTLQNMINQEL